LLELTWEALERAGQAPPALIGSRTGVFVGLMTTDYMLLGIDTPEETWDGYAATGSAHCFPAGRIAYTFGFQGPTMVVDTACSSSLVATHLACQSLRTGESDMAITGGANLMLSSVMSKMTARTNALSPDGRCKTFDARANGYVRGEGAGVLVLKRLSDAQRDGDPIFAVIRGSAVNQDGRSTGLTTPNVLSQQAMLRQALSNARVTSEEIGYVETHGTGTPLGDPIELEALRAVLGGPRENGGELVLGAVKTNIGHLEAAAGVAGLTKAILVLQQGTIPKNLHLRALNPRISLEGTPFVMPAENRPWPRGEKNRIAGVSSFGLSGTNAHVILEEAPLELTEEAAGRELPSYLLPLSAKTPEALVELAGAYAKMLAEPAGDHLYDIMYTAALRRMHHDHRLAVAGRTREELTAALSAFHRDGAAPGLVRGKASPGSSQKIVFVFPGQGSQWVGMGRQLCRDEPVFRASMELCHESIRRLGQFSLLDEIEANEQSSQLGKIHVVQATLFAIQVSLSALWRSWGVEPDAVVGHSMGEVAAARVSGILSLEDAVKVICRRSLALERIVGKGAMAYVGLSPEGAEKAIAGLESVLSVAVHNGPCSTVISGDPAALDVVLATLEQKGVFCRPVNVDVASHSPQVDSLKDDLAAVLNLRPRATQIPMISTVTGEAVRGPELTADYWVRNLRETVLFSEVTQRLMDDRQIIFVELSPHPVLLSSIEENLQLGKHEGAAIGSLRRNTDERRSMLEALGALHVRGVAVNWKSRLSERGRSVSLPAYPWQRQRYWIDGGGAGARPRVARAAAEGPAALLGPEVLIAEHPTARLWQLELSLARYPFLAQHRLQGVVVLPGAVYLEAAVEAARQVLGEVPVSLHDVLFLQPMTLGDAEEVLVEVSLTPQGQGHFTFRWSSLPARSTPAHEKAPPWVLHATAEIRPSSAPVEVLAPISSARARCTTPVSIEDLDRAASRMELAVGPAFKTIREAWSGTGEVFARVAPPAEAASRGAPFLVHPAMMDSSLRTLIAGAQLGADQPQILAGIREVRFWRAAEGEVLVHGRVVSSESNGIEASMRLAGADGRTLIELDGVRTQRISASLLALRGLSDVLYTVHWKVAPSEQASPSPRGSWLVLDDGAGTGEALRRALAGRGLPVTLVGARGASPTGEDIDPTDPAQIDAVIREAATGAVPLAGVVHLWGQTPEPDSVEAMETAQQRGCGSALSVAKAMIEQRLTTARLFLVTRGTQAVDAAPRVVAATHATVWGFGRSIAAEHPELGCRRIDLDPATSPDRVEALLQEILSAGSEDEIALRTEGRFVPRVARGRLPAAGIKSPVRADATYLVSGGLGGLGLVAAEQLAAEGARHLVLMGRGGVRTAAQKDTLDRLRASGVEVVVAQADVADEAQLDAALRDIAAHMPPLRGVLHTAGLLADGVIENQSWDRFRTVFGPKVLGAFNLHRRTASLPLDFFVLYSSMSALLSPPGVSNYVAANAYLDSLSHGRSRSGLVASSIDWGLFADVGMAVKATASAQQMESLAMHGFTPQQGAALLGSALRAGWVQAGLASIDFDQIVKAYPSAAAAPRFRDLLQPVAARPGSHVATADRAALRAVASVAGEQRRELLGGLVRAQLGKILRIEPARINMREALGSHGFDSLMGMELRNWLERALDVKLSMADIVANARGETLVTMIAERIPEGAGTASDQPAGPASPPEATPEPEAVQAIVNRPPGSWVVVPRPAPAARLRLFCFPYAGGSASAFSAWPAELPPEVELCAIQYPGRHERLHEALPKSVEEMVRELVPAMLPYLDTPFATFGHCLGAIVMYETLRELSAQHGKKPIQVFASAAPPPRRYLVPSVEALSHDEFTTLLRSLGFANESILRDADAEKHLLPAVRSDFAVAAAYAHTEQGTLDAPVTAFSGLDDGFAPSGIVDEWRQETTSRFSRVAFPGGHYFIVSERSAVLGHVGEELLLRLAAADQKVAAPTSTDHWIVRPTPKRSPRLRLFCFPGLGQSSADYAGFRTLFGDDIELCLIEPPGRGARTSELPLGDAVELGVHAARAVRAHADRPFAFLGHDLGALVMFESARWLRRKADALPVHLIVSAAMSPELHYFAPIHHLRGELFRSERQKLGLDSKLEDRALRADCASLSSYSFTKEAPLDIPQTIIAAERDGLIPLGGVRGWMAQARRDSTLVVRPGGHAWTDQDHVLLADLAGKLASQIVHRESGPGDDDPNKPPERAKKGVVAGLG